MWKDLTMSERAALIKLGVNNGITNLNDIRDSYNTYAKGGELGGPTPRKATPTKQRKFWESEEEYQERLSRNNEVEANNIKLENERIKEQDRLNRRAYLSTEEGKKRRAEIEKRDSRFFANMTVHQQNNSSLHHANKVIMDAMKSSTSTTELNRDINKAINQQRQDKLDKWHDYKKGIDATITATELGLSGASLLGAYANYKNWATATNAVKKGIANFLQRAQLPMQVGGTIIDVGQTYDAIQNNDAFETYYNVGSAALGTAGSIGASDVFLNSRFHSPKVDRVLDVLGIIQNAGDFVKFGYDTLSNHKKENGPNNQYAKGGTLKEFDTNYQKWRNSLPVNLREESSDYDLYGAYKAGLQPALEDDGYYHLGSRDPKTNRILKKPTHPTYLKAIIGDIHEGYYPVTKGNETYTLPYSSRFIKEEQPIVPFKYEDGGYKPSASIKKRISTWEGSSMKTNRPFEAEALDFNRVLPYGATSKLSQEQLDGLYSYSYNVGAGNFKKRVSSVLQRYLAGQATIQDVQRSMWASKDSKLRGLANRRAVERSMLGIPGISDPITNMMIASLPSENEVQGSTQEVPQLKFGDFTQPTSIDTYQPVETSIEAEEPTDSPLVGVLSMLQSVKSNDYYTPNHYNIRI